MTTTPRTFRHRTAEVEAVQWTGSNAEEMRAFCSPFDFETIDPEDRVEDPDKTAAMRESKHGTWQGMAPGDWAVKIGGGFVVGPAEDFAERYEPVSVPRAAPDQTALRDRVAAAIYEHVHPGSYWSDTSMPADWRPTYLEEADAVLAVLPTGDRAAVLRDLIAKAEEWDGHITVQELRRMAAEAQQDDLGETRHRERGMAQDIVTALARKAAASAGSGAADETRGETRPPVPSVEPCPPGCIACATDESHDPAPAVSGRPAADDSSEETRTVAYRSNGGRLLRCLAHAPEWAHVLSGDFHPVTSDDLPDGGVCTYPECGVDVLIPQEERRA